jgi:hypothetical protein
MFALVIFQMLDIFAALDLAKQSWREEEGEEMSTSETINS